MPQPLRIHQIKRIIQFQIQGYKLRHISRLTGISRNTILEYLRRIATCGRSPEELIDLSDEQLLALVQTDPSEKMRVGRKVDDRYSFFESLPGNILFGNLRRVK